MCRLTTRRFLMAVAVVSLLIGIRPPCAGAQSGVAEEGEPAGSTAASADSGSPRVEVHGLVDLRFAATGSHVSWLDGGLGRLRYGGDVNTGDLPQSSTAFHAGQLSLVVDARAGETLKAHVHMNFDADSDRYETLEPVGLVEGFATWSPVLSEKTRLRLRGGVMIPPFSLEHPEVAWSTRYTLTPSAIGSWLGEEVKSTGLEATFVFQPGASTELQLQGGVFSGNDSTGALLAWRGWAMHDRQGQLGDELPLPAILSLTDPRFFPRQGLRTSPFREIDGRLGFHAQARLRLGPHFMFQGAGYDNQGDTQSVKQPDYAWNTRFALAGTQIDLGNVTLIGQFMSGRARMGRVAPALVDAPFRSGFALMSITAGSASRLTFRYDNWHVGDDDTWLEGKDLNTDDGFAGTVAWIQSFGDHHRLILEYIESRVEHPFAPTAGELDEFNQRQFQAGYRLTF